MSQEVSTTEKKEVRAWSPNEPTSLPFIKGFLKKSDVDERIKSTLGENAGAFASALVTLVAGSNQLQQCDPSTIMAAAFAAASCKLSLEKSLGHAYIVPYKADAQFQIGWKGLVQLAMRSGQYKRLHVTQVYTDEVVMVDHVHGVYEFSYVENGQRDEGDMKNIAGYYATFELNNGFTKEMYMSKAQVEAHATKFSMAYRSDKKNNKSMSVWTTDPVGMSLKTLCKLLLNRWGILSIEMQNAIKFDQAIDAEYSDNQKDAREETTAPVPQSIQAQLGTATDAVVTGEKKTHDMTAAELAERSKASIEAARKKLEVDPAGF